MQLQAAPPASRGLSSLALLRCRPGLKPATHSPLLPHVPAALPGPSRSSQSWSTATVVARSSCCGSAAASPGQPSEPHHHAHAHAHHHHEHDHHHFPDSVLTRALGRIGVLSAAEKAAHSSVCLWASIVGFIVASIFDQQSMAARMPQGQAVLISRAAICLPWVFSGAPQILEALCMAAGGVLNTHVLMAMAAMGTLYMGLPHEGALLLLLFQLSHALEEHFTSRARGSLEHLFHSVPDKARMVDMNEVERQPIMHTQRQCLANSISIGQHVLVNSGEHVPLDGTVVWGTASVSLQHISGESAPVRVSTGAEVPAGSVNLDGSLVLQAKASMDDSTPARIARMAAEAQANRPKLQRTLDRVGEVWSKAVIAATIAALVCLLVMGVPLSGPRGALYRAMGVLTAGSPCAVVLVPLAYVCAIATITRKGVLVKSAAAIDALLTCSTIALDKTGTITSGALKMVDASVFSVSTQQATTSSPTSPALSSTQASSVTPSSQLSPAVSEQLETQQQTHHSAPTIPSSSSSSSSSFGAAGEDCFAHTDVSAERKQSHAHAGPSGVSISTATPLSPRTSSSSTNASSSGGSSSGVGSGSVPSVHAAPRLQPLRIPGHQGSVRGIGTDDWTEGGPKNMLGFGLGKGHAHSDTSSSSSSSNGAAMGGNGNGSAVADAQLFADASRDTAFGQRVLQYAVALSRFSNHPVSHAVVDQLGPIVQTHDLAVHHVHQVPGSGVQGLCEGGTGAQGPEFVSFGSLNFIRSCLPAGPAREQLDRAAAEQALSSGARAQSFVLATSFSGNGSSPTTPTTPTSSTTAGASSHNGSSTAVHGYRAGQPQQLAVLCFEDQVQPGARHAVQMLQHGTWPWLHHSVEKAQGSRTAKNRKAVVMLTGDNSEVASQVASAVGIARVQSNLKPEDKLRYVDQFNAEASSKSQGQERLGLLQAAPTNGLVMVGDGINDAPALAAARVGVAVASTPSDLVAGAADITILNGQGVSNLPWLFAVASQTHMIIRQNMFLALGAVVAATVPTMAGMLPLSVAVLLHEGSTLLVVLNSLRLLIDPSDTTLEWVLQGGWRSAFTALADVLKNKGHHHHDHDHDDHAHGHDHHGHHTHSHGHDHHHHHNEHGHVHAHGHSHQHHGHSPAHGH